MEKEQIKQKLFQRFPKDFQWTPLHEACLDEILEKTISQKGVKTKYVEISDESNLSTLVGELQWKIRLFLSFDPTQGVDMKIRNVRLADFAKDREVLLCELDRLNDLF